MSPAATSTRRGGGRADWSGPVGRYGGGRTHGVLGASGDGAEAACDELFAAGALADAPRQIVQLFDRIFHGGPSFVVPSGAAGRAVRCLAWCGGTRR